MRAKRPIIASPRQRTRRFARLAQVLRRAKTPASGWQSGCQRRRRSVRGL